MSKPSLYTKNLKALRHAVMWMVQIGIFAFSAAAAFLLRFDFAIPALSRQALLRSLPVFILIKITVFLAAKLDRALWRYVSVSDLIRVAAGNVAASTLSGILILAAIPAGFPRSIPVLDLLICLLLTCGSRLAVRVAVDAAAHPRLQAEEPKRIFIYGAGDAGLTLLREIRNNPKLPYAVCGFLDDRPDKKGMRVAGVPIRGGGDIVKELAAKHNVDTVLIAIPSATGTEMTHMLELCHAAGVNCKTIPGMGEVIEDGGLAHQIREVSVADLLGRTPVRLKEDQIRSALGGRTVLVTGAAGSIGSELCRQIARFRPRAVVALDIAESPLFEIDREMKQAFPHVPFFAEIGSILNRARVDEVLRRYRPGLIYHAAAYKHVPLMEEHVFEAIENNIFGTLNIAQSAAQHGVEDFVMISSDKAVRATNVMGATKRIAELLLLAMQNGGTQYIAVRFGNVLGSNGSVIPIFRKQIASGGPITVTHPEIRRFFMTIPEACQLVLQASAIGKGGQICVLDMGQAVKIVDLARNLILLSGLKPDEDIKIEFTGMRPGEKLYEELSTLLEETVPTEHEKIRVFVGNGVPEDDVQEWLVGLRDICEARDKGRLVVALKELVPDYNPSVHLLRRITGCEESSSAAWTESLTEDRHSLHPFRELHTQT